MDEAEFDKFASEYRKLHAANIKLSGEDPEYFAEYKIIDIAAELDRARAAPPQQPAVLDFGAGVGYSIPFFRQHLPAAKVTCLDVSNKSLEIGAAKYAAQAEFRHFDGATIPYEQGSFDIALATLRVPPHPALRARCAARRKFAACSSPAACCSCSSTIR